MEIFINSYGAYLHVRDEMFVVRTKEADTDTFKDSPPVAPHKVERIFMTKSQSLSTDVIVLALRYNVDIVFLEYEDGRPIGRIWHSKLGSTVRIRKRQLEASISNEGLAWVKHWIGQKLEGHISFLADLKKHRPAQHPRIEATIQELGTAITQINALHAENTPAVADQIRGLEGQAARQYYALIGELLPDDARFAGRSQRPAKDPFNAALNYIYGILYAQVERALIIAGIDPYVGFLHRDDYNQLSMVFDFIEPYRIYGQRVAFRMFSRKMFKQAYISPLANGVRLNDEGKPFVVQQFNEYFREERIKYRGRNQSRANALQMDAHAFAGALLKNERP